MDATILIVEDEMLVALEMEAILEDHGCRVLGIAADLEEALVYTGEPIDLAMVDLNLRDGQTGPEIGQRLATQNNTSVLFVTANPRLLGDGISGTLGVLTKPTDEASLIAAVNFALQRRRGMPAQPPATLRCFG